MNKNEIHRNNHCEHDFRSYESKEFNNLHNWQKREDFSFAFSFLQSILPWPWMAANDGREIIIEKYSTLVTVVFAFEFLEQIIYLFVNKWNHRVKRFHFNLFSMSNFFRFVVFFHFLSILIHDMNCFPSIYAHRLGNQHQQNNTLRWHRISKQKQQQIHTFPFSNSKDISADK